MLNLRRALGLKFKGLKRGKATGDGRLFQSGSKPELGQYTMYSLRRHAEF